MRNRILLYNVLILLTNTLIIDQTFGLNATDCPNSSKIEKLSNQSRSITNDISENEKDRVTGCCLARDNRIHKPARCYQTTIGGCKRNLDKGFKFHKGTSCNSLSFCAYHNARPNKGCCIYKSSSTINQVYVDEDGCPKSARIRFNRGRLCARLCNMNSFTCPKPTCFDKKYLVSFHCTNSNNTCRRSEKVCPSGCITKASGAKCRE